MIADNTFYNFRKLRFIRGNPKKNKILIGKVTFDVEKVQRPNERKKIARRTFGIHYVFITNSE